ncbi:MAG: type I secretion system permease/ATPase [Pseudomonadota bacterium]
MKAPETDLLTQALKECRPLFAGALAFSFVIALLSLAVPLYTMQVFDRVLSSASLDTLLMLTIIVGGCVLAMGLLQLFRQVMLTQISRWMDDKLSEEIVARSVSLAVYTPTIGTQPVRDLTTVRNFYSSPNFFQALDAPWAVLFFIVLYIINVTIGIVVTLAALFLLTLAVITQRWPAKRLEAAGDAQIRSMQGLETVVRNAEVVSAMGMIRNASLRWRRHNTEHLEDSYTAQAITAGLGNFTRTFRMSLQVVITAIGTWFVIRGEMSMGAIIAVNILTGKALAPFDASVGIYQLWVAMRKARKRLDTVLAQEAVEEDRLALPEPVGAVQIDKLTYQDPRTGRWQLRGVNLAIEPGKALGVIGPSGSGKTTLARLMMGVKPATSGAVLLDGAALDQWPMDQLSAALGYLPQDIELFSGTVAENIARMSDDPDEEAVIRAAQMAEVHEFILTLPEGYQTDIGEQGVNLSAGQRQRVALARCFYGTPKFVVLDEPNSNLDTDGEQALVQCLRNAREAEITVVLIAHRPALLHHVDHIAVLKAGELVMYEEAKTVLARLSGQNAAAQPLPQERQAQ